MNTLTAHDLHVTLGGVQVLRGVDLALAPGQVTVIIGPNGAGKSTLLTRLAGLYPANRGEVRLGETPLHH
jgi:ABC-type branched-subunit amino acid transport system ATPase component